MIDDLVIWYRINLGVPYLHYGIFPIKLSSPKQVPVLVILMCTNIFLVTYTKSSLPSLMVASFKVKLLFPDSML